MKIGAIGLDANKRSTSSFIDIPLNKISETESISAKQDGVEWRVGFRTAMTTRRTAKDYTGGMGGGPDEMHVGGPPHFVGIMTGHLDLTLQDGNVARLSAGDFQFIRPGALHNSTLLSLVPIVLVNLKLIGSPEATGEYPFK